MVFARRASSEFQFGALREEVARDRVGGTFAESLVLIGRRSTRKRIEVDDGVSQVHASSQLEFDALREMMARDRQGALSWRAW